MSSKLTFIGDVMLGRIIGTKYQQKPYNVVSQELEEAAKDSDWVIANLESPVVNAAETEGDHLQFKGNPDVLDRLKWIDAFSLSNNHINDCGKLGMDETTSILEQKGFLHNGLFKGEYQPLLFEKDGQTIAVVTITDMMNIPFADDCAWNVLRVGDSQVNELLNELHSKGYFVILYAHIGMLFTRYPNPITYNYLHGCADSGADLIVTAHSHCLGCVENYKGKKIFHSLGDFVMDGNSFRRRQSAMLHITIANNELVEWHLTPAQIDFEYRTISPDIKTKEKMLRGYEKVSARLAAHSENYAHFYKWQYKKEMVLHTASTLLYLYKTRGVGGMFKLCFKRMEEVQRMFKWMTKDRSNDQRDDDAIRADRKKFTQNDIFN